MQARAVLTFLCALAAAAPLASAASYTFTTINGSVGGISNSGLVTGYYRALDGSTFGFLYDQGTYTTIDDPDAVPVSFFNGAPAIVIEPFGVNNSGQVVGQYYVNSSTPGYPRRLGFLDNGGVFSTFDLSSTSGDTWAAGINDSGQIIGNYDQVGFLDTAGVFTTISDPLGTGGTVVRGIDNLGQIVGVYYDAQGEHAFLYSGGTYTTIDGPPGTYSPVFYGINDSGQIVGDASTGNPAVYSVAFLLNGGSFTPVTYPIHDPFGLMITEVRGINDSGAIIGDAFTGSGHGDPEVDFVGTPAAAIPEPPPATTLLLGVFLMLQLTVGLRPHAGRG